MRRVSDQRNAVLGREECWQRVAEDQLVVEEMILGGHLDHLQHFRRPPIQHFENVLDFARKLPALLKARLVFVRAHPA